MEAHGGVVGGHYGGKATTQKVLRARLWWPTLHKDAEAYCRACDVCKRTSRPSRRVELSLIPHVTLQSFDKWAIDFVGPIQPLGKKPGAQYIITMKEYLTKWAEAQPVKDCIGMTKTNFIFEYVLLRFGCPKILMSDRGTHFLNETISMLTDEFQMYH